MQPVRAQSPKHTDSSFIPVSTQSGWAEDPDRQTSPKQTPRRLEKTLIRASHQRNVNPHCREALPHTSQNGHHQNVHKYQILERLLRKGLPPPPICMLFVGLQTGAATLKNSTDCLSIPHSILLNPEVSAEGDRAGWQSG